MTSDEHFEQLSSPYHDMLADVILEKNLDTHLLMTIMYIGECNKWVDAAEQDGDNIEAENYKLLAYDYYRLKEMIVEGLGGK